VTGATEGDGPLRGTLLTSVSLCAVTGRKIYLFPSPAALEGDDLIENVEVEIPRLSSTSPP
jgi:hypothetical protein